MAKSTQQASFIKLVFTQIVETQKQSLKFEKIVSSLFELLPINTPLYLKEIEDLLEASTKDNDLKPVAILKIKTKLKKSWYDHWMAQRKVGKEDEKYLNEYYPKLLLSQQARIQKIASNIVINPEGSKVRSEAYTAIQDVKKLNDYRAIEKYVNESQTIVQKNGLSIIKAVIEAHQKKVKYNSQELLAFFMQVIEKSSIGTNQLHNIWYSDVIIDLMLMSEPSIFKKNFEILKQINTARQDDKFWGQETTVNFFATSDRLEIYKAKKDFLDKIFVISLVSPMSNFSSHKDVFPLSTLEEVSNFWKNFHFITSFPNQNYKKKIMSYFNVDISKDIDFLECIIPHLNSRAMQKEINDYFDDNAIPGMLSNSMSYPKIYLEQKALTLALPAGKKPLAVKQKI